MYIFSEWHHLSGHQAGKHPPWWRWSHCSYRLWALKVNIHNHCLTKEKMLHKSKGWQTDIVIRYYFIYDGVSWYFFQGVLASWDRAESLLLLRHHWVHGTRGGEGRQPRTWYCELENINRGQIEFIQTYCVIFWEIVFLVNSLWI